MLAAFTRFTAASASLLFAVLLGQITDATTGQPLSGVRVVAGGKAATTDRDGRYRLALPAGSYTLTWQSRDVPVQHASVTVHAQTIYNIKACSTTLDYSCGGDGAGPGSGGAGG